MRVVVEGKVKGKQRPRMTRQGHTYTPAQTIEYENWIKLCYMNQDGNYYEDSPVHIDLVCYFKVPDSYTKKRCKLIAEGLEQPMKKVDLDNVLKAVCDALNHVAFPDDAHVVSVSARKVWTFDNERIEFELSPAGIKKEGG